MLRSCSSLIPARRCSFSARREMVAPTPGEDRHAGVLIESAQHFVERLSCSNPLCVAGPRAMHYKKDRMRVPWVFFSRRVSER